MWQSRKVKLKHFKIIIFNYQLLLSSKIRCATLLLWKNSCSCRAKLRDLAEGYAGAVNNVTEKTSPSEAFISLVTGYRDTLAGLQQ